MSTPTIEFVNHASVLIHADPDARLLTDPWLDGTVFNSGWCLVSPSRFPLTRFADVTHIWLSHEHPDHFHPPTLKSIPACDRARVTVLFQSAPHLPEATEIKSYCNRLGFRAFVELSASRYLTLSPNVAVLCRHHMWGDSWLHVRIQPTNGQAWSLFNANDCEWRSPLQVERLFAELGPIDVLLMQFSYASWFSTAMERANEAARLLDRLVMVTKLSGAKYVIPFASFAWFCHYENRHMNSERNSLESACSAISRATAAVPIALYPGDHWRVGAAHDPSDAYARYASDYRNMSSAAAVQSSVVSFEQLEQAVDTMRHERTMRGSTEPMTIYLWDHSCAVEWNGARLERCRRLEPECDVAMASDSLWYLLRFRWGLQTLHINGRLRIPPGSRFGNIAALGTAAFAMMSR